MDASSVFRSSTAPRLSRPAAIRGSSLPTLDPMTASIAPTTCSSTSAPLTCAPRAPRDTPVPRGSRATGAARPRRWANSARKCGTSAIGASMASHLKGFTATTACCSWLVSVPAKARRPAAGCTAPRPDRSSLSSVAPEAMPPPAQAPHCMLTAHWPCCRQRLEVASSCALAAL